jgi:hypothetical protein
MLGNLEKRELRLTTNLLILNKRSIFNPRGNSFMNTYSAHLEPFRQLVREINQERATVAVGDADLPQSQISSVLCLDAPIDLASINPLQEVQDNVELAAIEFSYLLQQPLSQNDSNLESPAASQQETVEGLGETEAVRQRREGLKSAVSHDAFPMVALLMGLVAIVWVFWKLAEVAGQGIYAGFTTLYRLSRRNLSLQASNPVVVWSGWAKNPVEHTHLQKI